MPSPENVIAAQYRIVELLTTLDEMRTDLCRHPGWPVSALQQLSLMEIERAAAALQEQCKLIFDYVGGGDS